MTTVLHDEEQPVSVDSPQGVPPQTRVKIYEDLDQLPASSASAFSGSAISDFHLSLPWFRNFTQTALAAGERIRLYSWESENSTNSALSLLPMKYSLEKSAFQPRTLSSLTNYYSCLFGPLVAGHAKLASSLEQIIEAIKQDTPRWDLVRIAPMAHESAVFSEMRKTLEARGFATQEFFSFGNWYLPVEGRSFAEYMEGRPSILQNTLRRKSKKLEQSGTAAIKIVTELADVEKAIADYVQVYNASWKVPEPFPDFMPGLIRTCAQQGWLRLGLVYVENTPIAAQLWIVQGGAASIYKLAYDEKYSQLSAGTILTARLMEHALNVDHVEEIDYLSGDDDYKKTWMSHRRERWGILAFNTRTFKGALAMTRHLGGQKIKRIYQKLASRPKPAEKTADPS